MAALAAAAALRVLPEGKAPQPAVSCRCSGPRLMCGTAEPWRRFVSARCPQQGHQGCSHHTRVVVPDAKKADKDVSLCPAECFPSKMVRRPIRAYLALTCGVGACSSQSSSPPCWPCATSHPGARRRRGARLLTAAQSAAGAQDARALRSGMVGAAVCVPCDSWPVDCQALAVDAGTAGHGHQRLRLAGCGAECGNGLMRAAGSRAQASGAGKGRAAKPSPCARGHPGGRRAALL